MNTTNFLALDGSRVRLARKFRKITQVDLCKSIDTSQANMSFIEAGRHRTTEDILDKLSKVLDVTKEWLTGESNEGGVPIASRIPEENRFIEKDAISSRFIIAYERLKALGVIESDSWFCDQINVSKGNFSLALAGKVAVSLEWVPFLEDLGANRDFVYNNKMPVIRLSKYKNPKDTEEVAKNIKMLMNNIEEDMKQLKFMMSQVL